MIGHHFLFFPLFGHIVQVYCPVLTNSHSVCVFIKIPFDTIELPSQSRVHEILTNTMDFPA